MRSTVDQNIDCSKVLVDHCMVQWTPFVFILLVDIDLLNSDSFSQVDGILNPVFLDQREELSRRAFEFEVVELCIRVANGLSWILISNWLWWMLP